MTGGREIGPDQIWYTAEFSEIAEKPEFGVIGLCRLETKRKEPAI